jgi:hypothetical protein
MTYYAVRDAHGETVTWIASASLSDEREIPRSIIGGCCRGGRNNSQPKKRGESESGDFIVHFLSLQRLVGRAGVVSAHALLVLRDPTEADIERQSRTQER